ncbi:hypothetical protein Tco_1421098 [Tanacetum coccineum]
MSLCIIAFHPYPSIVYYTDSEPGRVFWGADDEEITDGGIQRVIHIQLTDRLPDVAEPVEEQPLLPLIRAYTVRSDRRRMLLQSRIDQGGSIIRMMVGDEERQERLETSGDSDLGESETELMKDEKDCERIRREVEMQLSSSENTENIAKDSKVESVVIGPCPTPSVSSHSSTSAIVPLLLIGVSDPKSTMTRDGASLDLRDILRTIDRRMISGVSKRSTWKRRLSVVHVCQHIGDARKRSTYKGVTELAELYERDTQDLYALLEDAQDGDSLDCRRGEDAQEGMTRISQRVTIDSQRVDLLMEDKTAHQETIQIVEEDAYASREAWDHAIGLSQAVHSELQTHREQVHETRFQMQQAEIAELRLTDRKRKGQMVEILRVMKDMRQEMSDMQAELLALRGQQRARQPGSDAWIPDDQDASRDADRHI